MELNKTLQQVKEHFKDAKKIACANSSAKGIVNTDKICKYEENTFVQGDPSGLKGVDWLVVCFKGKYAEIIEFKPSKMEKDIIGYKLIKPEYLPAVRSIVGPWFKIDSMIQWGLTYTI